MGDVDGYVRLSALTTWGPFDKPDGVAKDEVWIDADLSSQMFSVYEGETLLFTTSCLRQTRSHDAAGKLLDL